MKRENLMPGAIILLSVALLANAAAMLFGGRAPSLAVPALAQVQGVESGPSIYYVGRDTYFLTHNSEGDRVYLWYYDFSPTQRENDVRFVKSAQAER